MRFFSHRLWLHARVWWCDARVLLARRRVRACRRRLAAAELARDPAWGQRVLEADGLEADGLKKTGDAAAAAARPIGQRAHRPESVDVLRVRAWLDQNTAAVVDMTGPVGDGEIDHKVYEHAVNAVDRCNAYEPGDSPTLAVLAGFIAVGAAVVLEARLVRAQDESDEGGSA